MGCVIPLVDVSILPHAEFGPNDHREDAPHEIFLKFLCREIVKSRLELLDATKRLLEEVSEKKKGLNLDDLDEEIVNQSLYLSSTPQLLIRTSGEVRLSDFLLSKSILYLRVTR